MTWTDPDGGVWNLADLGIPDGLIATSVKGTGGPPLSSAFLKLPSGAQIPQSILPQPHVVTLGLYAEAAGLDQDGFAGLTDRVTRAFYTVRGGSPAAGVLTVQRADGSSRQMPCYCTAGLDQPDQDGPPLLWATWVLTLQGAPYWSDAVPQPTVTFAPPPGSAGVPPMPPVLLGSATATGTTSVRNSGDADAYPTWVVTGPGKPTVTNTTTGRSWSLDTTLVSGDVWTVVTSPDGQASVTDASGSSQWQHLAAGVPRDLWPLVPGVNDLDIVIASAGTGSKITMTYTRNWLRA